MMGISNLGLGIFTRQKKGDLNLTKLNKLTYRNHFKVEFIQNILNIVRLGASVDSVDLKDAIYSVSVIETFKRYL